MDVSALLEAGLIQFGRFKTDSGFRPIQLHYHLLGSYPDLVQEIAQYAANLLQGKAFDHIASAVDTIPFSTALSLHRRIPLVYSQGGLLPPAQDWVGAYDVGHPSLLVVNVLEDSQPIQKLIDSAARVGLEIQTVLAITMVGEVRLENVEAIHLFELSAVIHELSGSGRLTSSQAAAVLEWIAGA